MSDSEKPDVARDPRVTCADGHGPCAACGNTGPLYQSLCFACAGKVRDLELEAELERESESRRK